MFNLKIFSHQHAVLILSSNGLVEVKPFTDAKGFKYDLSMPVTGCPVEGMSFFDDFAEASANFLKRSSIIVNMCIEDIHIIHLQSGKTLLDTLLNVFPVGGSL